MDDPNDVHVAGRATQAAGLRYTARGTAVAEFTLAVHRDGHDWHGRPVRQTVFVLCLAWREQATIAAAVVRRGRQVDVKGRLCEVARASGKGKELAVRVEDMRAGGGPPEGPAPSAAALQESDHEDPQERR